jgi:hypothetical protein
LRLLPLSVVVGLRLVNIYLAWSVIVKLLTTFLIKIIIKVPIHSVVHIIEIDRILLYDIHIALLGLQLLMLIWIKSIHLGSSSVVKSVIYNAASRLIQKAAWFLVQKVGIVSGMKLRLLATLEDPFEWVCIPIIVLVLFIILIILIILMILMIFGWGPLKVFLREIHTLLFCFESKIIDFYTVQKIWGYGLIYCSSFVWVVVLYDSNIWTTLSIERNSRGRCCIYTCWLSPSHLILLS